MTVTLGTPAAVDGSAVYPLDTVKLSSTLAMVIYLRGGDFYARTITTGGDPPTVNAESSSIDAGGGGGVNAVLAPMTSTSAMVIYKYNSTTAIRARVLTVSGTTITVNSNITLTGTANDDIAACAVSSTKILFSYVSSASLDFDCVMLSVVGTTITENAIATINNASGQAAPKCTAFSTTKALVCWVVTSAQDPYGCIINISGNTLTPQTPKVVNSQAYSASNYNYNFLAKLSATAAVFGFLDTGTPQDVLNVLTLSGNTFTVGSDELTARTANTFLHGSALDSTNIITVLESTANTLKAIHYSISGTTLTEEATDTLALTSLDAIYSSPIDASNILVHYIGTSSETLMASISAAVSHIWLSTDGAATFTDIGDSSTWGSNVVGGVVVVPGTAYQTIFAAVGTSLYKTVNGGTAWTLETAVGYEVDFIDLEKDNTTVFLAKRDAAGTNRASLWDSVGASLTHINTGKSTTGGATSGGDVV